MERYWVPHEDLVVAPWWLRRTEDAVATFVDDEGVEHSLPAHQLLTFPKVQQTQLQGIDNICNLEEVSQAALLHTVRTRYARSPTQIYTRVAKILISVNPFKPLPIYSSQQLSSYIKVQDSGDLPPHIFCIGLDALNGLTSGTRSQAILISGESGAGKTESTKQVLTYIAEVAGSESGGIQDRIIQVNPILEAFGNAMTVRNNNSSRFGKWLEVWVDRATLRIRGCQVTDYLLELTRVCGPGEKERNYHVFFQLAQAAVSGQLPNIDFPKLEDCTYVQGSQLKAPGVDDGRGFEELKEAFFSLGFNDKKQQEIYTVLGGILALGNCSFQDGRDMATLESEKAVEMAAALLKFKDSELRQQLLYRKITVGKEVTHTQRSTPQARAARDGLSRLIYGRLFKWLIKQINNTLTQGATAGQFFGVLDIAGFESFDHNSLEQLFINLSNEHLQHQFNNFMFRSELADYQAEGVDCGLDLSFQDNADIVTLIDSKGGLLAMLDEEVSIPKANDTTFLSKVFKTHEKHSRLIVPKFDALRTGKFGVRHFPGEVMYSVEGFLDKNVDKPPDEAPALFCSSQLAVLKEIGEDIEAELNSALNNTRRISARKVKTVSSGFRASLSALMDKINDAEPHYVRCIKPNADKVPDNFNSKQVMEQLLCSGVMEAVRIRQHGYASRMPFADFLARFRCVLSGAARREIFGPAGPEDDAKRAQLFVKHLPNILSAVGGANTEDVVVGQTKVFAKAQVSQALEKRRDLAVASHALHVQAGARGFLVRRMMKSCEAVFSRARDWSGTNCLYDVPKQTSLGVLGSVEAVEAEFAKGVELLEAGTTLPVRMPNAMAIEKAVPRMESEVKVLKNMKELVDSIDAVEMQKVLARAKDLNLQTVDIATALAERCEKLKTQLPLTKGMEAALEEQDLKTLQELYDAAKAAKLIKDPDVWLPELNGIELAGRVYSAIEDLKAKQKLEEIERKRRADLDAAVYVPEPSAAEEPSAGAAEEGTARKPKEEVQEDEAPVRPKVSLRPPCGRRRTLTGLTGEQQDHILSMLDAAGQEFNAVELQLHLSEATKQGLDEDLVAPFQDLLQQLQTESFLTTTLQATCELLGEKQDSARAIRCLQNLIAQANSAQVAKEPAEAARTCMQNALRRRVRSTVRCSLLEQLDPDEISLIHGAFSDLANYRGMKKPSAWKGHKTGWAFSRGSKDSMLNHSKLEIREGLTQLPQRLEGAAVRTFHDILGWMNERPVASCQRQGLAQTIVEIARCEKAMGDEVYVQIMKQMTGNPSARSISQGWRLMLLMCQQVPPGDQLEEFLRAFLMRALASKGTMSAEDTAIARQCVADLNVLVSPEKALSGDGFMSIQVSLIDGSARKLHVKQDATLAEVGERVADQLRIHNAQDFSFYQMTEGLETHRLLPDATHITTLFSRWSTLKEKTCRVSRLLYKRRFLWVDETLSACDMPHALLTYQQALWDYQRYPVREDPVFLCQVAATILCLEHDHYREIIKSGKLADPGVLEGILPELVLRDQKRTKWAKEVSDALTRLQSVMDPSEPKLVKMSRVFSTMQKMKLFGAYFWLGRQTMTVDPAKVAVVDAPNEVCKINQKEPEAEYWICVDLFGIRFLSVDSAPGSGFQRGFLFNEEAVEQVLHWGAKQNVLQLVVATINPASPQAGRLPMAISLISPAAIDIAYAIHVVCHGNDRMVRRR